MSAPGETLEVDFRRYAHGLWRRKWAVVACVVLAGALAYLFASIQTPRYRAGVEVLVQPRQSQTNSNLTPEVAPSDPTRVQKTEIRFLNSPTVRQAVQEKLGSAPAISARPVPETNLIQIQATHTDPRRAAEVANAYADAYVGLRRNERAGDLEAAAAQLQTRIDELQSQIDAFTAAAPRSAASARDLAASPELGTVLSQQAVLKQRLDQLRLELSVDTGGAQVVTPAAPPAAPYSPDTTRTVATGLGLGALVGVALALGLELLDDSIRTDHDLAQEIPGLPVLGMIPEGGRAAKNADPPAPGVNEPSSRTGEAYRSLRTSLQFVALDQPSRVIQITSPSAGEGKSTTVANLGVAFAAAGKRVILISCDLRRPRLHELLGVENRVGFTSVLLGEHPLTAAVQRVPAWPGVTVLASGPSPPNPSELLSSRRAAEVVLAAKAHADLVLLDSSPIVPVTDGTVLAALADATVMVVRAGKTTRKQLGRAVELLRQVDAPMVGTVLNGVAATELYGYGYGYGYGPARTDSTEATTAAPATTEPAAGTAPPRSVNSNNGGRAAVRTARDSGSTRLP